MKWPWNRRAAAESVQRERESAAAVRAREADQRLAEARKLAAESRTVNNAKQAELDKNGWTELFTQALARRA